MDAVLTIDIWMTSIIPVSTTLPFRQKNKKSVRGVAIGGTGSAAPSHVVTNEDLAGLGCDTEWIIQRTGIRQRHHAPDGMATSDLAFEAAEKCLAIAQLSPSDLDMIIISTMTPDYPTPSTACVIQNRLKAFNAAAMDLNAACSGFAYGMITGSQFIRSGDYRHVLVIGADIMSRVVNPTDVKTYPLFGDGAGAVLLSRATTSNPEPGILSYQLGADGSGGPLLVVPGCGSREPASHSVLDQSRQYLKMDGKPVFKWAVRLVSETILSALEQAELTLGDIQLFVLHQANIRIIDAAVDDMQIPRDKVIINLDRYGNTSAASIPIALDEAFQRGLAKAGDKIVLCGFGAGLTWGTCVVQL